MEKDNKREMNEMKRELAMQLLGYIDGDDSRDLKWTGTKTNLIELVSYLYLQQEVRNEYDIPLSMMELTRKACWRFGVAVPKSLSRYLENISNVQGVKSHTVLELSMIERHKYGRKLLISRYVSA